METTNQRFALLIILLSFYCAGPILILAFAIRAIIAYPAGLAEDSTLLGIVKEIASSPGAYLNTIHQMIMPVVAAITAASYATTPLGRLSRWLFILPLATIFVCLANAAIFNLYGPADSRGVMAQLFVNTATNLAVYVMLFVGLQLSQGETK